MGIDIASYIKKQRKKGYTDSQIKSYLVGVGYSAKDIDVAMNSGLFSFLRKKEPDKRIVSYIEQSMARGFKPESIEQMLAQYYRMGDINVAMKQARKDMGVVHHVIDVSNRMFVLALFGIVILGLVVLSVYLLTHSGPKKLLDYELEIEVNEVLPGEKLYFVNNFVNMGNDRRYDIVLEYKIIYLRTGIELESKGETLGVSTTLQNRHYMEIPPDATPGRYRIEGLAIYGKDIASSYANFRVIRPGPEPSCDDGILNQGEDDIDCGGPCAQCEVVSCYDNIKNQDEERVDCGGVCRDCEETCFDGVRNQDEEKTDCGGVCQPCRTPDIRPDNEGIIEKVKGLGDRDEGESLRLCKSVDDDRSSDECYLELSHIFNQSSYCEEMISSSMSNICYMHFVQNRDYTVCDKIEDIWIRRSCESLRQISDILKTTNQTMPNAQ